ncbi:hypothetical protein RB595_005962 [Gaeumannomyces hyphopodioides]
MHAGEDNDSTAGSSPPCNSNQGATDGCTACRLPPVRGVLGRLARRYPLLFGRSFRKDRPCELRATDDGVVTFPIPPVEQQSPVDRSLSQVFFFVPHAVDEPRLRSALDDLIRNHWTLLGARLARRHDGRLEYRLPARFPADPDDDSYRLFGWSAARHAHGAAAIPGVLQLPTEPLHGARLQAWAGGQFDRLLDTLAGPAWPRERVDAPAGMPMMAVHVSAFIDGAVVGVCLPHTLADQMGFGAIMKAWLGLVAGKPPPPLQARPPLVLGEYSPSTKGIGTGYSPSPSSSRSIDGEKENKESSRVSAKRTARQDEITGQPRLFSTRESLKTYGAIIPEILMSPREVQGTLFLPLTLIVRLRSKIFAELEERYGDEVVGRLGLSEGDVVSAILCKLANVHRTQNSTRPVSLGVVVNLRGRIPELPRGSPSYVHNAIAYGFAHLGKVHRSSSLAEMAYRHRLAVLQMSEPEAIESGLDMIHHYVNHGNKAPMLGDPGDRPYIVSNWTAAWKGLDFSAALARDEPVAEKTAPVKDGQQPRRLLVLGRAHTRDTPLRYVSMVMCKSSDGYWAMFAATKKNMKKVEELLLKDPLLVTFL